MIIEISKVNMKNYSYEYVFYPNKADLIDKTIAIKEITDILDNIEEHRRAIGKSSLRKENVLITMSILRYEVYKQFGIITYNDNKEELFNSIFMINPTNKMSDDQIGVSII